MDGENNIIVLDDDINIVAKHKALGGGCATVHDGILYAGTGPRDSKPHRFNNITMFNLEDCRPIATMTLDYGSETRYAAQCLASDGKFIYAVFYAANGGMPCVILTPNLKIVKTVRFNGSTGFDFLPPSRNKGPIHAVSKSAISVNGVFQLASRILRKSVSISLKSLTVISSILRTNGLTDFIGCPYLIILHKMLN